jgi:hypothetical protein
LNVVLLQSLLNIYKDLQQGPTTSNVELQQSKKLKNPSDTHKHGLSHINVGISSSKKRHQYDKKGRASGRISKESSSGNATIEELYSIDIGSSVPKKKKKRHSHISLTE